MYTEQGTNIRKVLSFLVLLGVVFSVFGAGGLPVAHAQDAGNGYFSDRTIPAAGGKTAEEIIINGPPTPPPGSVRPIVTQMPKAARGAVNILTTPAFSWSFGCTATSAAMEAGYYDRTGYPNMYTGPTNNGYMPLDNSSWGTVVINGETRAQTPLSASRMGLDGRTTKGSADDYWVKVNSTDPDPYITGAWTPHVYGGATGDFMKTNQSAFGNVDGSTTLYSWPSGQAMTPTDIIANGWATLDGGYGLKLFYESRGYTVTTMFTQRIKGVGSDPNQGFTFANFKSEIDGGHPVLIHVVGHTMLGVGYEDATQTVYLHDTWDYATHTMTWGGWYSQASMTLWGVTVIHLAPPVIFTHSIYLPLAIRPIPLPGAFAKSAPVNGATGQPANPSLSWTASSGAVSYQYCVDTVDNGTCDTPWVSAGAGTSANLSGLAPSTNYFWQVQAINTGGATNANGGAWWFFNTAAATAPPGAFTKSAPLNGAASQPANPSLTWTTSSGAASYQYCVDTVDNGTCDTSWVSAGTSASLNGLTPSTNYFWQVRANNAGGTTNANAGAWWYFITAAPPSSGIVNGDFEAGSTGWTEGSLQGYYIILPSADLPHGTHGGNYAAWLGGVNNEISFVEQQVTISSGAPYLVYWQWISSVDTCGHDFGGVEINGSVVDAYNLCASTATGAWVTHSVNLSAYVGQSVMLQIRAETNATNLSSLYIDDVSLRASAGSAGGTNDFVPNPDTASPPGKSENLMSGKKPQIIFERQLFHPG